MRQREDARRCATCPSSGAAWQEGSHLPAEHFLIEQTLNDLATLEPQVRHKAIHGENSNRVIADIMEHTKHTSMDGEILLVTHAALMLLPYIHRKHDWHLIMDEVPQADWCAEFSVADTHRLITDCFTVDTEAANLADNRYVRIVPKDRKALEQIARNRNGDEVYDIFQQFANMLISQHWATYVLEDQYQNLLDGVGNRRKLLAFAHLRPSLVEGFASATIMGACFKQSTLYALWSATGVEFRPHRAITNGLRYTTHENGHLLAIRYATDEDWSKCYRDKTIDNDHAQTVQDRVVQRISETFADVDFAWLGNKVHPDDVFGGRGQRLPNSPHGLNCYQHLHDVAVLSALNPPPAHFAFLDALGFDSREVKRAGYWQAVYQALMRVSPRNPDDTNRKTAIVMDRATAEWLASMFPGCTIEPLGGLGEMPAKGKPGRHRRHDCDADRKRASREKYKAELRMALDLVVGGYRAARYSSPAIAELRKQMSEFGHGKDTALSTMDHTNLKALGGTVFASIFHAQPLDFFPRDDAEAFIDGLRYFHQFSYARKDANGLISPAIFDPSMSEETSRGLANIRAIWGIWLDNDGGDLTHEEFARMFPHVRMVIVNSFSSTPEKPRWRVFLPTIVAMPIVAHQAICHQIMRTLNGNGYWSKKQLETNERIKTRLHHAFDMSKLTPSSLFYLPCQADHPDGSFFIDHNGPGRQPLDPYVWAGYAANHYRPVLEPAEVIVEPKSAPIQVPPPPCPSLQRMREMITAEEAARVHNWREQRVAAAIADWRATPAEKGNEAFFRLAVDLRGAGLDSGEIEATLRVEAEYARHPDQRRRQIKFIVRGLRSPSHRCAA